MAGTGRSTGELQRNMITRVNVGDALSRTASRYPDAEPVVDGDRRWTWTELEQRANRLANGLLADGYAVGDRLAIMAGNCAALYATDARVQEVAVVGLPHERWSEAITAVVVPVPGEDLDGDALRDALRPHLDGYKIPKSVIVLDELPKTSTGKIQKNVLRDKHSGHYGSV